MSAESLIDHLSKLTDLSPGFIVKLKASLTEERYRSRQVIQAGGQTANRLWYLKYGLARSYFYDEQGDQHTLSFWNADEFIFSYAGFLKEPSKEYIEVLAESELYSCTYVNLAELTHDFPETSKIVGVINRQFLQKDYKRSLLHTLRTKERYHLFRKENPQVFSWVPLWIIASYLHMTRENLSRIISEE
jgi:CRP-like cAMP-binding protein